MTSLTLSGIGSAIFDYFDNVLFYAVVFSPINGNFSVGSIIINASFVAGTSTTYQLGSGGTATALVSGAPSAALIVVNDNRINVDYTDGSGYVTTYTIQFRQRNHPLLTTSGAPLSPPPSLFPTRFSLPNGY